MTPDTPGPGRKRGRSGGYRRPHPENNAGTLAEKRSRKPVPVGPAHDDGNTEDGRRSRRRDNPVVLLERPTPAVSCWHPSIPLTPRPDGRGTVGLTGVETGARLIDPGGEVAGPAGGDQPGGGVEHDDVTVSFPVPASTRRARSALVAASPPSELFALGPGQAEFLGVDHVGPHRPLLVIKVEASMTVEVVVVVHVQPVVAVNNQRVDGAVGFEHADHLVGHGRVADADHLPADPGQGWPGAPES